MRIGAHSCLTWTGWRASVCKLHTQRNPALRGSALRGKAWPGHARLGDAGRGTARRCEVLPSQARLGAPRKGCNLNINVTIEGKTPLIMNRFTDAAAMAASNGTSSSIVGDKGTPREQAATKVYQDSAGQPAIPQPNLFRCLIDAGLFFKAGKSKVTTQKSSMIPACVEVDGVMLRIESAEPWQVDTRPVRIPSTGGRILCHRPIFNDWRLSFSVEIDETMISPKLFRDLVDAAGKRIGLGDFRPACKGPFGKFVVIRWEQEAKEPMPLAA